MSGFDGIFGSNGSVQKSSLFKDVKPSSLLGSGSAPSNIASKAAPGKAKGAKHSASHKIHKRAGTPQENPQSAGTASKRPSKKAKSDKPVVAAAAATSDAVVAHTSAATAARPAKRQKASKGASAPTVSMSQSESAAAKAAQAAAAKLLKLGGIDREDLASPPVHETLQRQAVPRKRKVKPKVAAGQKQAPMPSEQTETPAERIATGSAAPAEQPLDAAPNGVEQAMDSSVDDKLDRTIFVGNLRAAIKPKAIKQLFSRYGSVESVRLRSVPVQPEAVALPRRAAVLGGRVDADRATAHAYVVFAQPEHAQAALAHNMQVVDGLHLRVDMATGATGTAGAKSYSRGRSIFVGNLPFTAQDEDIVQLFTDASLDPELADSVTAVRVVRDRQTNIGKGIAFVEFKTKAAAAAALRLAEPKLHGRPLRITFLKQPKASAVAAAAAEAVPAAKQKRGEAADGSFARERIRKQKMAEGVSKKAARQPWMGERAKKLEGAAPKGKRSLAVKLPIHKGVHRKPGSATRPAAAGQPSRGPRRGKPLGKGSAGRKAHSRPTQTAAT